MGKVMVVSFQSLTATSGRGMARLGYLFSKEMHRRGLLKTFVIHSKGKFETPFPSEPVSFWSRYYLFALNKLNEKFNFKTHKFRFLQEQLFDWFCAQKVDKSVSVIFTTQPYMKRTFKKARKLGIKTMLLSGTAEDNYMYNLVKEENEKLGVTETDAYTYDARNKYFNDSMKYLDISIGFFPTAYRTFGESTAFKGRNVKFIGHMTADFPFYDIKKKKKPEGKFVVGFMAYTVVLKGLHYLLEAWKQLMEENDLENIELLVGGPMHPFIEGYVKEYFSDLPNTNFLGSVTNVPAFMESLDLFVIPSLIEGGPLTALEASHYAIPVLITNNAGSYDMVERGDGGGYVVPMRDPQALKEKILWAYNNREENYQKGLNAKYNVDNYKFEDFLGEIGDFVEEEMNEQK